MRPIYAMGFAAALFVGSAANANAQTSLDGFGSLSLSTLSSSLNGGFPIDLGGGVSFGVLPGIQLRGEFGRLGNVLPDAVAIPVSFAPATLNVSAFYGEGGIRFLLAHESGASPYLEGTAGVAHLRFGVDGLSGTTDAIVRAALNYVDTRDPIVGFGGGVLVKAGAVQLDLGYRYKRILSESAIGTLVSAGQHLQSNQLRFGVGVKF